MFFGTFTLFLFDSGVCLPLSNRNELNLKRNHHKSNREKSNLKKILIIGTTADKYEHHQNIMDKHLKQILLTIHKDNLELTAEDSCTISRIRLTTSTSTSGVPFILKTLSWLKGQQSSYTLILAPVSYK